jgi:hypothetical protein
MTRSKNDTASGKNYLLSITEALLLSINLSRGDEQGSNVAHLTARDSSSLKE